MKAAELREKSKEELQDMLIEQLRTQFNLRMQQGSGQLDKPSEMKNARKNIARIKTIITEKQTGEG